MALKASLGTSSSLAKPNVARASKRTQAFGLMFCCFAPASASAAYTAARRKLCFRSAISPAASPH